MAGRPKGIKNYTRKRSWQPVVWHSHYDEIVQMAVAGISNKAIARKFSLHPVQVSNILNSDKGRNLLAHLTELKRLQIEKSIEYRTERIAEKAFERIEYVINSDELFENHPFSVFDRAKDFLKNTKSNGFSPDAPGVHVEKVIVTNNFLQDIRDGLAKIEEISAKEIKAPEKKLLSA